MTNRIPHQEGVINGNENVKIYARAHEKNSNSHFFAFLKALQSLNLKGRFLEIGSEPGFLTTMVAEIGAQIHDFQIKTPFPYFWMTIIAKNQQQAA